MKGVLDTKGVLLALFLGAILLFYGGAQYLALMLIFFLLAVIVTKYEYETKKNMGIYEHERGWENVLSNGLLPAILAVASPHIGMFPFIAGLAAVMADKFGSEIGVLDASEPISLFGLRPVRPGTSGAMSRMGTVGSLAGACAIGFAAMYVFGITPTQALLVGLAGLGGSIADTIVGVFEERGFGTKGTSNFICSVVGALLGYYLIV